MLYAIKLLEERSHEDLCTLFSRIPIAHDSLQLAGKFNFPCDKIEQALGYLPRHITSIDFMIHYHNISDDYSQIGSALQTYSRALPPSIRTLRLEFRGKAVASTSIDMLVEMVRSLPQTITQVEINGRNIAQSFLEAPPAKKRAIFASTPDSVQSLAITRLRTDNTLLMNIDTLSSINTHTKQLKLEHCNLYLLDENDVSSFFTSLPRGLNYLSLAFNKLNKKSIYYLIDFFREVPVTIESLSLRGNELAEFSVAGIGTILSSFPESLKTLDISDNQLLSLDPDDLQTVLICLPQTVTALGIYDNNVNDMPPEEIGKRFALLPRHIKCVIFSHLHVSSAAFSLIDFVKAWSYLPATVEEIDLSSNALYQWKMHDILYMLKHLPAFVHKLKLRDNGLSRFSLTDIRKILSALPPQIRELDIGANGINRFSSKQVETILGYIPPTVKYLITGYDELRHRYDGVIVPHVGFFQETAAKPENRFYNQQDFAKIRVVMMQLLMQPSLPTLPTEMIVKILSYVFAPASNRELERFLAGFSNLMISSKPPQSITYEHEEECLSAIQQRIENHKLEDSVLDLSRCGLNRLISKASQDCFIDHLISLPRTITHLKLRSNGFGYDGVCLQVFCLIAYRFPAAIRCLDLGDNGLEYLSAANLKTLFHYLPSRLNSIILDHGEVHSPAEHIARRKWSPKFNELTSHTNDKVEIARILFSDYTKWNVSFLLFLSGHWGRTHRGSAAKIVHSIQRGAIQPENLDDEIISQYRPENLSGCFAMRLWYLAYNQPELNQPELDRLLAVSNEESGEAICCF